MDIHTIPRTYVSAYLSIARLPLDVAARVTNHATDGAWAPALAFDEFAANVRQIVGALTGDQTLEQQGRAGQARVAEYRDALHLRVAAEQTEAEAEDTARARRSASERRRREAAERVEERRANADRLEEQAKIAADAQAATRAEQARQAQADRKKAATAARRSARTREISKERAAVGRAKAAGDAQAAARTTGKKIQATKAQRRSA